ncbi:MAG: hypothetical protein ABI182_08130 [Candidatus Baltobacteraceae bacterium]
MPGIGDSSVDPFVYQAVAQQLEHQLNRYRDTLTLGFGIIAVALASIAYLLTERATKVDDGLAAILMLGGILAAVAVAVHWDAKDAPDAEVLAAAYALAPPYGYRKSNCGRAPGSTGKHRSA